MTDAVVYAIFIVLMCIFCVSIQLVVTIRNRRNRLMSFDLTDPFIPDVSNLKSRNIITNDRNVKP